MINIVLCQNTCELICFKLCMMLDDCTLQFDSGLNDLDVHSMSREMLNLCNYFVAKLHGAVQLLLMFDYVRRRSSVWRRWIVEHLLLLSVLSLCSTFDWSIANRIQLNYLLLACKENRFSHCSRPLVKVYIASLFTVSWSCQAHFEQKRHRFRSIWWTRDLKIGTVHVKLDQSEIKLKSRISQMNSFRFHNRTDIVHGSDCKHM